MNRLQKKFILISIAISTVSIGCALLIHTGGDLYLQPAFFHLFARYDMPSAILAILLMVIGIYIAPKIKKPVIDRLITIIGKNPFKVAGATFIILSFSAFFIYHRHPLCMDEYMPYFQATIFSKGKLWGQYPPALVPWLLTPNFFAIFSPETGRVVSDYWPGFSLLLAPFVKIGVPWLLNPLISAGTIVLAYYYTKKVMPSPQAPAWVLLLTLSSTVFLVNGISFYSMSAHLFLNLLYATLLLSRSPFRLFSAGAVGSLALTLHTPVPHLLFSLPWIVWIACDKNRIKNIGILFLGYLPLSLLFGLGWVWLKILIAKSTASLESIDQGITPVIPNLQTYPDKLNHMLISLSGKAAEMIGYSFRLPNAELLWSRLLGWLKLFAWAVPGLPILAILGTRYLRGNSHLQLWGYSAVCTLVGFFFVPYSQGHGWGFRYFHSSWLALAMFAATFLTSITQNRNSWKQLIVSFSILSLIFFTGLRFYQVHQFIAQHISQLPRVEKNKNYIRIIDTSQGYYIQDLIQNDPFLNEKIITLRSRSKIEDQHMIAIFFPDAKKIYRNELSSVWEIPTSSSVTGHIDKLWPRK